LRKAGATIAAENGATDRQLMALYDRTTSKLADVYTKRADKKKLAGEAAKLIGNQVVNTDCPTAIAPPDNLIKKAIAYKTHWQEWRDSNPQPPVLEYGEPRFVPFCPIIFCRDFQRFSPTPYALGDNALYRVPSHSGPKLGPRPGAERGTSLNLHKVIYGVDAQGGPQRG
jgi:hypothetical protein